MSRKMLGNLLLTLTAMIWGTAFVGQIGRASCRERV